MSFQELPSQHSDSGGYGPIRTPTALGQEARAAVFDQNGRDHFVRGVARAVDALNPTGKARADLKENHAHRELLRRHYRRRAWLRAWLPPTLEEVTGEKRARIPRWFVIQTLILLATTVVALIVSNRVLANYVTASGQDLYASNPSSATIFAMAAGIAAIGIKCFERKLKSEFARAIYARCLYATALAAFLLWAVMTAVVFAPNVSTSVAQLLNTDSDRVPTELLVFAHALSDVAWSCLIYSTAEDLALIGYKRTERPNPAYIALGQALDEIKGEIARATNAIGLAENYIVSVDATRDAMCAQAELEFDRAYALWEQGEANVIAIFRRIFLSGAPL